MLIKNPNTKFAPFYEELFEILSRNCESQIAEVGIDSKVAEALLKNLSSAIQDELLPLPEIIENYQQLYTQKGSFHIEKALMESFDPKDFLELGLTRYFPKVYRGLPRVYLKDQPLQSHIKMNFTNVVKLKALATSKALFSLYAKASISGKVTLFTWVMSDGLGDFIAASEVLRLLKARLDLDLCLIALVQENAANKIHFPESSIVVPYKDVCPSLSEVALKRLKESDLILQLPTFYPETEKLMKETPQSRWEMIGEYGFIESSWFHPKSDRYCLGLHFLEKGILTRRPCLASWDDLQNEQLKKWRNPENRFYLAYLATQVGGAIYLHSLLKSLENDPLNIDLCVPDLNWFIDFSDKQKKAGRPILEWDLNVSAIDIYFDDRFCRVEVAKEGKKVRLLCPGTISQSDFRALLSLSGEWVAIRGNQSFSEAVSQGKAFFYDGREHARYFVKDLAAIAENRIGGFPGTLECIRGMTQSFLYKFTEQEETWVDETYFQELEDWTSIALKLGFALQNPETFFGFEKLNRIITEEFSANSFFCHLVQRALFQRKHPYVEQLEKENLEKFGRNEISFKELILAQKAIIDCCQKNVHMG